MDTLRVKKQYISFGVNNQRMLQGRCKILLLTSNLPRHVSAANCHLQGVTRPSQATLVLSVPQLDVGYGLLSMSSCCGICPSVFRGFSDMFQQLTAILWVSLVPPKLFKYY